MTPDYFEATFVLAVDRETAWTRLTARPVEGDEERYWLPGFDAEATVVEAEAPARLRVTKDEEPCAGTDILVTLEAVESGTKITVVQSRFGDWLPAAYDVMCVGWRHIVADFELYLFTGVHGRRHLRAWGDLGTDVVPMAGGLRLAAVREGSLADRLGLRAGDLLTGLAGAPVANHDDLATVLRVITSRPGEVAAEWVRAGEFHRATAPSAVA